ncbi:MAG: NAD(P)H-binding protein [Chloroflexi bacterium]|nr:NAD(P)H-binding protein [Chloroflexota bacterium]
MDRPTILLCGGTGALGGSVARHLHARGVPFRALVRPASDAGALEALGAEVARGDLRDAASLTPALDGIRVVVTTANAIGRILGGDGDLTIRDVDDRGNANLIGAAQAAGVERFVFVSMLGDFGKAHAPFTDAKLATEGRLRSSRIREVIVRPDMFQEIWLGPAGGFDLAGGKVRIFGKGRARHRHVAIGDVADVVVRLALADDPPRALDLAGPDPLSAEDAVAAFSEALGRPLKVSHVPRLMMRVGRTVLRPVKPAMASVMGMALAGDLEDTVAGVEGFSSLGIEPRGSRTHIAEVARRGA